MLPLMEQKRSVRFFPRTADLTPNEREGPRTHSRGARAAFSTLLLLDQAHPNSES
jgi:hypothetical protein